MAVSSAPRSISPCAPFARLEESDLEAIVDAVALGVIVVDVALHILFMNAAAQRLLDAGDVLRNDGGALRAARVSADYAVRRRVQRAVVEKHAAGVLVPRTGDADACVLVAVPLRKRPAETPASVLFVSTPDTDAPGIEPILAALFGLTPAEASVAAHLARGHALGALGDRLGVTRNTLWTHLKRVLSKTGTRGQIELVRRIVLSLGALRLS